MLKKYLVILIIILSFANRFFCQTDSVSIIPEKDFSAGSIHRSFFGDHWRDLWTTSVKFPVLDLSTFGGGIVPIEKGGGQQTKSLRFKGGDGNIWKFRSIIKDPSKVLPEELRKSLAADVLKDQISSANPYGALVANYILDAAGVLNAKPYLCYLPDDTRLNEFKVEFQNLPGFIEIHPDENEDGKNFANAEKITSTYKLYRRFEKEYDEKINACDYLKARLVDCLMGDWDRHNDQWRWARFTVNGKKLWSPIPRDRDQVFPKFDGLLPAISTFYIPQFCSIDDDYPSIYKLTWNGRYPDQRFLPEISKNEWDSVAAFVKTKITNEVIEEAVKKLPPGIYELSKDEIISVLKSRRDKLKEFSDEYYEFVNEIVDIYGKEKDDYALIERKNNGQTSVALFEKNKKSGLPKGEPYFQKVFDNDLTDEIRIYLLDGDDNVLVKGETDDGPIIRVIGGEGADQFNDSSEVKGFFLSVTPFSKAERKTFFYDSDEESGFVKSSGTVVDQSKWKEYKEDSLRYEQLFQDRRSEWFHLPIADYNKDNGVIFGFSSKLYSYDFRMNPYSSWIKISPTYATNSKSANLRIEMLSRALIENAKVHFDFDYTEMFLSNYFGYGNTTPYNEKLIYEGFYRMSQHLFRVQPEIIFEAAKDLEITTGLSFRVVDSDFDNKSLLANFPYGDYGYEHFNIGGIHLSAAFDTRDVEDHPYCGSYLSANWNFFPQIFNVKENFSKAGFDLRQYFTSDILTKTTFAFRFGGEKLFGKYPFFSSAFLGGGNNLRGYNRERFSGDASLFSQAETRFFIAKINYIIPSSFGANIFIETGRVFAQNSNSKMWNSSYGFGFWLSFLDRKATLLFTTAFSDEEEFYYFTTRMGF
jgi:hypothetical protein